MLLFHNGLIHTRCFGQSRYSEALLIHEYQVLGVGSLETLKSIADNTVQWIDLQGKTLMPAFTDAHIHLWKVGDLLTYMLDLRGVRSREEMVDKLADFARKNPQNPWILARGFNEALFEDRQIPTRYDLDKVGDQRPVHVIRTCAHIAVLNSIAMEKCQINAQTLVPIGGEIRKDTQGIPNGILSETALGLAKKHLPEPSPAAYRNMVLAAQDALLNAGIAVATDPAVHPELLEVYKQMDRDGELKIRLNAVPIRVPDGADEALPLPELYESDFLKIDTVKFFSDGGLSGKTAALSNYYRNSTDQGVLRLEHDFFLASALEAQQAGFRVATHAIGGRAIDMVLSVYDTLNHQNERGLKHRIEHLGLPTSAHLAQMRDQGIHCVTQAIFLYELGSNFRMYLDDDDLERVYPFRSVLEAGINLAFSSDAPVVKDFNPWMGIQNAVLRTDREGIVIGAEQTIGIDEAIAAYTTGAAAANGDNALSGTLSPGYRADFIILNASPFEVPPQDISKIKVIETWVNGKKVTTFGSK